MTTQQAEQLVERLIAAYPQTPMREQTSSIYAKRLVDLGFEAASRIVDDLIATEPKFPSIAEIRGRVGEESLSLPTPLEAYASIFDREREIHRLTRRVADLFGGVYNLKTSENPSITRAQFLKAYEELRSDAIREANLAGLRKSA